MSLAVKELKIKGIALSSGCAIGRACLFNENRHRNLPVYQLQDGQVEKEKSRVVQAIEVVAEKLKKLHDEVEERLGHAEAEIFVAHGMIIDDPSLRKEVFDYIENNMINAESAVTYVLDTYEQKLLALQDEYLRTRATDFAEIKGRILDAMGNIRPSLECDAEHCKHGKNRVIVAEELTPSLTVDIDPELTIGFVTEHGGVNSHAAILARALGVPAVSGLEAIRDKVGCGTELLINGDTGEIFVWPSDETISSVEITDPRKSGLPEPVDPVDGFRVMANISLSTDVKESLQMEAEGVGLYRTEFEIIAAERLFSEDELYETYMAVGEKMAGRGVIYRLFDLGSDKTAPFLNFPSEENPSLGWRGARLLLGQKDLLITQARALARVSACKDGRVHVMYPMIVDVDQFLEIKDLFMSSIKDIPYGEILHGIMFEVPSACLQAKELFEVVDFASVGTNDLTQYLFAVDRDNDHVSYDYNPDRKVFWDIIGSMADAARKAGKPLSICGELAGYSQYVPKLIDLGVQSVSVSPRRIPEVRIAAAEYLSENNKEKE